MFKYIDNIFEYYDDSDFNERIRKIIFFENNELYIIFRKQKIKVSFMPDHLCFQYSNKNCIFFEDDLYLYGKLDYESKGRSVFHRYYSSYDYNNAVNNHYLIKKLIKNLFGITPSIHSSEYRRSYQRVLRYLYIYFFKNYKDGKYFSVFQKMLHVLHFCQESAMDRECKMFKTSLFTIIESIENDNSDTHYNDDAIISAMTFLRKQEDIISYLQKCNEQFKTENVLVRIILRNLTDSYNLLPKYLFNEKYSFFGRICLFYAEKIFIEEYFMRNKTLDINIFMNTLQKMIDILSHHTREDDPERYISFIAQVLQIYKTDNNIKIIETMLENMHYTNNYYSSFHNIVLNKEKYNVKLFDILEKTSDRHKDKTYYKIIHGLLLGTKQKNIIEDITTKNLFSSKILDFISHYNLSSDIIVQICTITKPSIVGNINKNEKILKIYICALLEKTIIDFQVRKEKWNMLLNWIISNSSQLWKIFRNSKDNFSNFLDYVFVENLYDIKKFNDKMSPHVALACSIAWHNVKKYHQYDHFVFPDKPWLPYKKIGDVEIIPLNKPMAIVNEGVEMHHCVATYCNLVAREQCYIYSVVNKNAKTRATLCIRKNNNLFEIQEMRGACNVKANDKLVVVVNTWLNEYNNQNMSK